MNRAFFLFYLFIFLFCFGDVFAFTVSSHVPEKYREVQGGDRLYFELTLKYPENPTRVDLRLEYKILDNEGNVVTRAKGLKAVETQASFLEFIVLPENMENGPYTISIDIKDYGDLSQNVEAGFNVVRNRVDILFNYIYILTGAVFVLMILIIVILLRRGK
jgi:hypothetical protein